MFAPKALTAQPSPLSCSLDEETLRTVSFWLLITDFTKVYTKSIKMRAGVALLLAGLASAADIQLSLNFADKTQSAPFFVPNQPEKVKIGTHSRIGCGTKLEP